MRGSAGRENPGAVTGQAHTGRRNAHGAHVTETMPFITARAPAQRSSSYAGGGLT